MRDVTGSDFWTFDIHHNGDFSTGEFGGLADGTDDLTSPFMGAVSHVNAADVCACMDQFY